VVAETSDRVLVMYGGQVVEQGATAPLFAHRLHPYTDALLGCVPRIDGVGVGRGSLISIQGSPPDLAHLPPGCRFAPRCPRAREQCSGRLPALETVVPQREVACLYPLLEGLPGSADSYQSAGAQA
jgi:oligopeptide/dipeptide ABC transporter ATP-binding protein